MRRAVSIAEAKDEFAALVHEAERHPVEIERRGKRVAVLLSAAEYDRLAKTSGNAWKAVERFRMRHDLAELDLASAFDGLRDPSPGPAAKW